MSPIVAIARTWIGTPYHHQASLRGVGTDCVGLIRGIYRDLYGREAEGLPAYSRDWAEATGEETLIAAARRHLVEIGRAEAAPGDVLVFRYRGRAVAKHAGLLATPTTMIHAMEGCPVSEVALSPWWRRRLAAAFRFPDAVPPSPRVRGEGAAACAGPGDHGMITHECTPDGGRGLGLHPGSPRSDDRL
jgi:NlpC/P60 family putative phage cell wall peptidase